MIVYYFTEYDVAMQPGLAEAGWNGRGWYFWDEAQTQIYGPYKTEAIALKYGDEYATKLAKNRKALAPIVEEYNRRLEANTVKALLDEAKNNAKVNPEGLNTSQGETK